MAAKPTTAKPSEPKTVTIMGVKVAISPDVFDDWRLIADLTEMQSKAGDGTPDPKLMGTMVDLVRRTFGSDYDRILDALADKKTGRTSVGKVLDFFTRLMEALAPNS